MFSALRNASGRLLTIVAALSTFPAYGVAQFTLDSPFGIAVIRDNRSTAGAATDNLSVQVRSAALTFRNLMPRISFSATYQPDFIVRSQHDEFESWNHVFATRFSAKASPRFSVDAGGSFLQSKEVNEAFDGIIFQLPESKLRATSAYVKGQYQLTPRMDIEASVDDTRTTLSDLSKVSSPLRYGASIIGLKLGRSITPRQRFEISQSFMTASRVHHTGVGYDIAPTSDLTIHLSGGVLQTRNVSYSYGLQVQQTIRNTQVTAEYQRGLAVQMLTPVLPDSVYQILRLSVTSRITRKTKFEVGAVRSNEPAKPQTPANRLARASLEHAVSDRAAIFVEFDYYGANGSDVVTAPQTRTRYRTGLNFELYPKRRIDVQ